MLEVKDIKTGEAGLFFNSETGSYAAARRGE